MKRIKGWFSLPEKFNELDEYIYRRCQVTNFFLVMFMLVFGFTVVLNILYGFYSVAISETILIIISYFVRKNLVQNMKIDISGWLTIIIMTTLVIGLIFLRQGVQQSYVNTLLVPIVGITILGYKKGAIASIIYSGLVIMTLWYGSNNNWQLDSISEMYINVTLALFGVICTMVYVDWTKEVVFNRVKLMALKDPLTGIWNRKKFEEVIEFTLDSYRKKKIPFSMLIMDIDHFKKVNDTFGHDKGDEVLVEMARRIEKILSKKDTFVRWGGEEFAIVMPEANEKVVKEFAEQIIKRMNNSEFDQVGKVTVSIGYGTVYNRVIDDAKPFFREIDEALYLAKRTGRNRALSIEEIG